MSSLATCSQRPRLVPHRARSAGCWTSTKRARADHGHRLWCLLMLELWRAPVRRRRLLSPPRETRRPTALVAAAAVLPRLAVLLHERERILTKFTEKSDDFAQTFVHHGTFGFLPGEPSAYTQPLYGFFLVAVYWLFGRHWLVVGLAQTALALAAALLVYAIGSARRLEARRRSSPR